MKKNYDTKAYLPWGLRMLMTVLVCIVFSIFSTQAQIKINGNVYGGGNKGDVSGSTAVTVRSGDLNKVYGGARMADVGGNSFVNIDGEHASSYILINYVFGGNDIAGIVGKTEATFPLPTELTQAAANGITTDWRSFVRVSTKMNGDVEAADNQKVLIGQLFGGGNGDYTYSTTKNAQNEYEVSDATGVIGTSPRAFQSPVLPRTYLEILGGSIANVYGGGNFATVTEKAVICVDNPSTVVTSIEDASGNELLTSERLYDDMGLNFVTVSASSDDFQISNLFGGNNKADMAIRPTWHLKSGSIRNLYSGGNEGDMTSPVGLILDIPATSRIVVDNVYGGCRMGDVHPKYVNGDYLNNDQIDDITLPVEEGYKFPAGLSARVLVRGGSINNVYGGNDIKGDVYGGTAVGVYCSIKGDVYGGGNGSYAYTDNPLLKNTRTWRDFYYDVNSILGKAENYNFSGLESAEALARFRPNAERVSVRVYSPDFNNPTIIGGSIYVGGNSATLRNDRSNAEVTGELKIGSHVIADHVFLANNGVNMVDASPGGLLARYQGNVEVEGVNYDFSRMDLLDKTTFAKYMDGCAMSIHPSVVFDSKEKGDPDDYEEYSTTFGSLYCGGNVGSMKWEGTTTLNINHKVVIFDKVVAGCNNANVYASEYNAEYCGGVIGTDEEQESGKLNQDGSIMDCLVVNLSGIKIQPKRWQDPDHKEWGVEWNTIDARNGSNVNVLPSAIGASTEDDLYHRLKGGNIYGGCYNSGHVNGNVVINITDDVLKKDEVFDIVTRTSASSYNITRRNSGVILDEQAMDPLGGSLNIFGGGYGRDAEIWGSTTINIINGYAFRVYGGGELGGIGKHAMNGAGNYIFNDTYTYSYDARYSTHINLHGTNAADETNAVGEAEYIYGGSFEAPIAGNTIVHLGNGRVYNSFAGSCNADIQGHAETYVGLGVNTAGTIVSGFPYVRDDIFGGNDLGGRILGEKGVAAAQAACDFSGRVREAIRSSVYNSASTTKASSYIEYRQGHVVSIFGGAYGDYDYTDAKYVSSVASKPRLGNAFINFCPVNSTSEHNGVQEIYGAGQGRSQVVDRDKMQERSYLLIDIPQSITTFQSMKIFGAGSYCGLGMELDSATVAANPDMATAVIDLFRGQLTSVYGAGYKEGVTRRTMINVPAASTVNLSRIFGGAYGINNILPCDTYESNINFNSSNAIVSGGIYGGNNDYRRTIFSKVNINGPVYSNNEHTYQGTVYGAGKGEHTWSEYTEVNINDGGVVYKVFGGGEEGQVLNYATLRKKKELEDAIDGLDLTIGSDYNSNYNILNNAELVHTARLDGKRHNTNVHINQGGDVTGYAYGAGLGEHSVVSGTTYGDVLGGIVEKDFYAGGQGGAVRDIYSLRSFKATANLYVESGSVRNCYGGGYLGDVGYIAYLDGNSNMDDDVLAQSNVVVGKLDGTGFYDGIPAVTRNAYGGGEGGSIYGNTHLTINNGYIGYRYTEGNYVEELVDGTQSIEGAGNCFGGGYILNSYVDSTYVNINGGVIRGSVYGGGELGPVGRGQNSVAYGPDQPALSYPIIHKGGAAYVTIYGGHIKRDVFGGGRGEDSWGGDGTMYMSDAQKALSDFNAKGFVYGITRVALHGGEIGTTEGVAKGYGNVFGGGDIGFVYSSTGTKVGSNPNVLAEDGDHAGLPLDGGGYYYINGDMSLGMSLDCSVDVSPSCKVIDASGITIDGKTFSQGEFVPVEYLNKLRNKIYDAAQWNKLNLDGIIIHNAIFAGGNVSAGSDKMYVNTKTIYGNAVAALRDVYHRDLITIGTEHTGGLYGDGNLTFVDGYRELHVSNYGTDYFSLDQEISVSEYEALNDRERAYFVLNYKCRQECVGKNGTIEIGKRLTSDEFKEAFDYDNYGQEGYPDEYKIIINEDGSPNEAYFEILGFCSLYAGRLLNTIQRADMVGVFGSRMVLQGAVDRVPEKVDYTKYTINRVGELSLNKSLSVANEIVDADREHGNYFGIYSVVNYLGAMTSDVFFTDVRKTDVSEGSANSADGTTTYFDWKLTNRKKKNRNNGTSTNKLALASGVYLEIINEDSETLGETDWGYITGIIELDLIDVMTGLGGGYVYARNEHGVRNYHENWNQVILSPYNSAARTYRKFTFDHSDNTKLEIETSGNFVHNTKQIVDDCFPTSNSYKGANASKAHYWYIKGSIYVYDQYISAYTGSSTAYSQNVSIPLTITAASHGMLTLREVQPNLYAYYDKNGNKLGSENADETFEANGITYSINDPITWWEWNLLSSAEQSHFVKETYTTIMACEISDEQDNSAGDTYVGNYPKGYTLLPSEYTAMAAAVSNVYCPERENNEAFSFVFRQSNNLGHDTGYLLTFDIDNPANWNNWYTNNSDLRQSARIDTETFDNLSTLEKAEYTEGPTFYLNASTPGVYGQKAYNIGDVIAKPVYDSYQAIDPNYLPANQASFEEAYVVTAELTVTDNNGGTHHLYPGVPVISSDYPAAQWTSISNKIALANIITSTLQLSDQDYLYAGELITDAQITEITTQYPGVDINDYVAKAYYCSSAGNYGGQLFELGTPYRAIDAWCSLSETDRQYFTFSYDAFDVLVDPTYAGGYGNKSQYDGTNNPRIYSVKTAVNYQAQYTGTTDLTYVDENNVTKTIHPNDILTSQQYEDIPNEQYHYSPITITEPGTYYVVRTPFIRGDLPYTAGEVIDENLYLSLNTSQKDCIDLLNFTAAHAGEPVTENGVTTYPTVNYYYCRNAYDVGENGEGRSVTTVGINGSSTTYNDGDRVLLGSVITQSTYNNLVNKTIVNNEMPFTIFGSVPNETSTLYVSRESDIYDLSKEKIITLVYLYEYEESDESGMHITPISERHVLNIHLDFKSGVPQIGQLSVPPTIIPGSTVGLKVPTVTPGAYEVLSSGWELYTNGEDASSHTNGLPYINNNTPMYWYQDGYWVAYYAKTYLGKTYSNAVPFSVANYHDLDRVMQDKENHMFVDHEDVRHEPKIYIDSRNCESDPTKSELDLLKDFFDLSLQPRQYNAEEESIPVANSGALNGHHGVNTAIIGGGANIDFILRSDVSPKAYTTWTSIGTDQDCFGGTLHGDGYTISGLTNSLFHKLCGQVYNLGVTGSFSGAGIVDTGEGYVENCWISTTGTPDGTVHAVFGNPTASSGTQIVNCYYPAANNYKETANSRGNARKMPVSSFYNGEVTYNLNGFYLNKRYYDQKQSSGTRYGFYRADNNGTLSDTPEYAYYPSDYAYYPLNSISGRYGYVENRYADGDFIYADGTVPETRDVRVHETHTGSEYYPIWPDDYIFFGQKLNYGYINGREHQDTPSHINKVGSRLTSVSADLNRVYRAPAYFRSGVMSVAHYNPYAVFAQKSNDGLHEAYKGMTAIDFTGSNGDVSGGYAKGWQGSHFFPPLLDPVGLEALRNADLTRNWLVYAPAATNTATDADSRTNTVVTDYLPDIDYSETNVNYRTVDIMDVNSIRGHAIVKNGNSFTAYNDHLLVDKQDFNAPIRYSFASGNRMYYQRKPDNYVDINTGWESVSLPFEAELVTTQTKGELTHFYGDSRRGHEYWLREYRNISGVDAENRATAIFKYPDAASSFDDKLYKNTYLWDYYYSANGYDDANSDDYQESDMGGYYYKTAHTYADYPLLQCATPYIIGFPGARYYEFDLSGTFEAKHTAEPVPGKLAAQTITFASDTGISIEVSDGEMTSGKVTQNGYTFWPNYLNGTVPTGGFVMSADGGSYVLTTDEQTDAEKAVLPFRAYFTSPTSNGIERVRQIIFSNEDSSLYSDEEDNMNSNGTPGRIIVRGKRGRLIVTSTLAEETTICITTATGLTLDTFSIGEGETVETPINQPGVYIVTTVGGNFNKKVTVK